MTVLLIIIGAVLLLLLGALLLRVRILLRVDEGFTAEARMLFLRKRLFPRRKRIRPQDYSLRGAKRLKEKQERKAARKAAKRAKKQRKRQAPPKGHAVGSTTPQGRTAHENLRLVRALLAALSKYTKKHLRLHAARLHVRVATGDAATTAIAYGAISQSLAYLLFGLDKITKLKARPPDVAVIADFLGERTSVDVRIELSIRVWGILATLFGVALTHLRTKRGLKAARRNKAASKKGA